MRKPSERLPRFLARVPAADFIQPPFPGCLRSPFPNSRNKVEKEEGDRVDKGGNHRYQNVHRVNDCQYHLSSRARRPPNRLPQFSFVVANDPVSNPKIRLMRIAMHLGSLSMGVRVMETTKRTWNAGY